MANAQTIQVNLKVMGDVQDVISNMSQVQKALTSLKLPDNLKNSFSKTFQDITKETTKIQSIMSSGFKNKGDVTALEKSYQKINQLIFGLQNNLGKITPNILQESFQIDTQALEKATKEVEKFKKQLQTDISTAGLDGITQKVKELTDAGKGGKSLQNFFEQLKSGNFSAAEKSIKTLESSLAGVETRLKNSGKDTSGIEEYREKVEQIHNAFNALVGDSAVQQTNDQLIKALQNVQNLNQTELTNFINQFNNTKAAVEKLPPQINKVSDAQRDAGRASVAMANDMDQIRSRIQYFFGLTSAVNLFKRAVKSAFDTVKELDKTMTEAAVVTEFDVSDMWSQLPTYASQAKALGATINDLYGATTLYYQQGLKTKEAMELGNETLRMARIGSLEAADATQYMTAALRGFNMEINQTSGERVNDVYSKLAAITASDTAQIAIAMSKTASIANSANMEFENTAALLSQIIETTQEAPETAGTALKTIIARFSEVKKLTEKGLFSGEDEEGEIIEVNKISSALASVGISMNKFFAGEEGLDSILMKLASKWDSLDFSTQRYIATAAAGSRQQSRFIAMMSNYDRTLELADAASNSAGASQEQFGKTLESLDSKLNRLKDAWDQFTMGLANSDLIKGAIDALTGFLDAINKIINSISGGKGFAKTITSAFLSFGAFKLGKNALGFGNREGGLLQALIGNKKQISKQGKEISLTFVESVKQNLGRDAKGNGILKDYFTTKTPFDASSFIKNGNFDKQAVLGSLDSQNPAYEALFDKTMAADKAIQQFGADSDEAKKALEDLNSSAEKAGAGIQKTSTNLNAVAHASQLAGAGLIALSSAFDTTTKGGRVASGVIKGIGVGLLSFGTILPMVSSAFKTFGLEVSQTIWNIPIVGWIAGIISLLIALGTALANTVDWRSGPEKASDSLEILKTTIEKTKEQVDELNSSISEIGDKRAAIDNMVVGTNEWQQAVYELNEQILNLVKNSRYLDFSDINIGENGIFEIDAETFKRAQEQSIQDLQTQQKAEYAQGVQVNKAKLSDTQENKRIVFDVNNYLQEYKNLLESNLSSIQEYDYMLEPDWAKQDKARLDNLNYIQDNWDDIISKLGEKGLLDEDLIDTDEFNNFLKEQFPDIEVEEFNNTLRMAGKDYLKAANDAFEVTKELESQLIFATKAAISEMGFKEGSEEEKVATNFITPEEVERRVEEKVAELDSEELDKNSDYVNWAQSFGENVEVSPKGEITYTEKDANGDNVARKIDKDSAIEQFARGQIESGLKESVTGLLSYINDPSLSETEKKALMGEDLTGSEYLSMTIDGYLKGALSEQGLLQPFLDYLNQQHQLLEKGNELQNIGLNEAANKKNLSGQAKSNIVDQYNNVERSAGKSQADWFASQVSNILSTNIIADEDQNSFFEAVGNVDWTKGEKSIEDFYKRLDESGVKYNKNSKLLSDFVKILASSQKVLSGFTTDNIETSLRDIQNYEEKLKNKTSLSFTNDEMQEAINRGAATEDDFIQTGEDEWQYVSGPIDNLIIALNENTAALVGDGRTQIDAKLQQAKEVENHSQENQKKFFDLDLSGLDNDLIKRWANLFKNDNGVLIDNTTGKEINVDNATDDALRTLLQQYQDTIKNGNSDYYQGQLNNYNDDYKDSGTADEIRAKGGSEDAQIGASIKEAENAGIDTNTTAEYAEQLAEAKSLSSAIAMEIAKDEQIMNLGAKELGDTWDKNIEAIQSGGEEASKAIESMKKPTSMLLGISDDLSDGFFKDAENLELIEKAIEGDAQAFNKLQQKATKDLWEQSGLGEFPDNLASLEEQVANADLDVGEIATGDLAGSLTTMYNDAYAAAIAGGKSVADAMAIANSLIEANGFEAPEIEMESKTVYVSGQLPPGATPIHTGGVSGPDGQFLQGYDWKEQPGDGYTYPVTMMVPKNYSFKKKSEKVGGGSKKKSGGGGGGGGSKKQEKQHWENPYDKLYNVTEKINETLRDREALERAYDRLLQNRDASAQKLLKNSRQQIQNLKEEAKLQQQIVNGRASQLKNAKNEDYLGKKKVGDEEEEFWTTFQKEATRLGLGNLDNYATYNQSTGLLQINWDKIEAIEDDEKAGEDKGGLIEKYVSYLEEQSKSFEEAQDRLDEINDEVYEIEQRGKEEYLDFSQRIIDAIINQQQKQIDTLSELDDTITDTNSRILDGIQEQVDLSRQIRDNTKTEDEIAKKEARLAYLRRDTSGANALEIKKLEEELNDARENYSDQLVDQALQKLSDDNEKASQQRQDQIELMQTQLDYWTEIGAFNARMEELFSGAFNKDGTLNNNSELVKLLQETEGFQALSKFGKEDWMQKLAEDFYAATEGQSNFKVDEAKANKKIASGMAVNTSGNSVGALTYNSSKGWVSSTGTYGTISWDESLGKYIVDNYTANPKATSSTASATSTATAGASAKGKLSSLKDGKVYNNGKAEIKKLQEGINSLIADKKISGVAKLATDGIYGAKTKAAVKVIQKMIGVTADGLWGKNTTAAFKKSSLKAYKLGGLADFTGPAWLDGSKSKPEMVLNPQDTKNFIILKDVLGKLLEGDNLSSEKGGDNYYEIHINVDEIANDYDVDKLIDKVKKEINNDARYRNVNAINLLR